MAVKVEHVSYEIFKQIKKAETKVWETQNTYMCIYCKDMTQADDTVYQLKNIINKSKKNKWSKVV